MLGLEEIVWLKILDFRGTFALNSSRVNETERGDNEVWRFSEDIEVVLDCLL